MFILVCVHFTVSDHIIFNNSDYGHSRILVAGYIKKGKKRRSHENVKVRKYLKSKPKN